MGNAYFTDYSIVKDSNDNYTVSLNLKGTNFQSESFVIQQDDHPWFNAEDAYSNTLTASNVSWTMSFSGFGSSCKLTFRCKASKSPSWQDTITIYTPDEYSSERLPSFYPEVTHQLIRSKDRIVVGEANTCVANAIATLKEIHEHKEGRQRYNKFSIGWIYGNRNSDHLQTEGMYVAEALDKLMQDGTPPYEILPENANYNNYGTGYPPLREYPDIYEYTRSTGTGITAKQLVQNNYNSILKFAQPQRISSYSEYIKNSTTIYNIKQSIINNGAVLLLFNLYDEFYNVHNNGGIAPEFYSGSAIIGHNLVIMGWKKINGISYWICQNSWGDWSGDNGLVYMPFWTNIQSWYYLVEDGVYPLPKAPTPSLDVNSTVKTGSSIQITINPIDYAETYYARINGGTAQSSSEKTFTFTGLAPNTQYFIEIACIGSFYSMSDWSGYYATTLPVSLWSWTATERNAFNNKGLVTTITYQRWNEFVDAINTTCNGDWWTSANEGATLNYSSTKMTSSDKILTASRFNSIRYNIGARVSTGLNRVYKGDNVLGSYFITLEAKLNEWITNP